MKAIEHLIGDKRTATVWEHRKHDEPNFFLVEADDEFECKIFVYTDEKNSRSKALRKAIGRSRNSCRHKHPAPRP